MNNQQLEKFEITMSELKACNDRGLLHLGKTLGNALVVEWNNLANHTLISGYDKGENAGAVIYLLHQLTQMNHYNYEEIYITSSSEWINHFNFSDKKEKKVTGLKNQLNTFKHILAKMVERERLFDITSTRSIVDFNEKFPHNKLPHMVLVVMDWHESYSNVDKKLARELTETLMEIMNIARSSGCVVITTTHSALKGKNGISDKFQNHMVGYHPPQELRFLDSNISEYMLNNREEYGTYFIKSINIKPFLHVDKFKDSPYTLVQIPLIVIEQSVEENNTI